MVTASLGTTTLQGGDGRAVGTRRGAYSPTAVTAGHRQISEQCSKPGLGKYVFRDLLQQRALSQLILKAPLELLGSVV